jgi:hypothetical protein
VVSFDERIADFLRETGADRPAVDHLTEAECERLRRRIAARLRLPRCDGFHLVEVLRLRQVLLSANICDEDFSFSTLVNDVGLRPLPFIYVNWAKFNIIDRFESAFIMRYLPDLLYPGGDYVDLFDDNANWIASIDYECHVRLLII